MIRSYGVATKILDGCRISNTIRSKIGYKVGYFDKYYGKYPGLAVVRIGDSLEMERYVYAKKNLAFQLGVQFSEYIFPSSISNDKVEECIHKLNNEKTIHGIIVQLPLPNHLDTTHILNCISPHKDVDGCCDYNQHLLQSNSQDIHSFYMPCAAMAMQTFLSMYHVPIPTKRATIIGKSMLVGQPCYHLLQQQGYHVDQCDISTPAIPSIAQQSDLLISAVGKPGLITADWVKPGACIIDIGTRCVKDAKGVYNLTGDVDLNDCIGKAGFITPVPGGIALLTTAMLMVNTLKAFVYQEQLVDAFNKIAECPLICLFSMSEKLPKVSEKRYCDSEEWNERYSRQIRLDNVGIEGQKKINEAKVLIIGAGGLGSPVVLYLAGSGIGYMTIIDDDIVEISNIHRQIGHSEESVEKKIFKAESLKKRALELNSHIHCTAITKRFSEDNAKQLIEEHDVIIDCCDNVETRYLINDECVRQKKSFISGATQRYSGQVTIYGHSKGPCFRCLYPTQPVTPDTEKYGSKLPILSPLPGVIGSIEAVEALKQILGIGSSLEGRLFLYNGDEGTTRILKLRGKSENCTLSL